MAGLVVPTATAAALGLYVPKSKYRQAQHRSSGHRHYQTRHPTSPSSLAKPVTPPLLVPVQPPPTPTLTSRPVDCNSGSELPSSPGYISKTFIFKDVPQPGWSWFPYLGGKSRVSIPGSFICGLRICRLKEEQGVAGCGAGVVPGTTPPFCLPR